MGVFDWFRQEREEQETRIRRPKGKRVFDATANTRFTRDWSAVLTTPDSFLKADLNTIRARSRDAVRNSEFAKRALEMYKQNVVGDRGIALQNQSRNRQGRIDRPASLAIEQAWKEWGKARNCDLGKQFSLRDIQRLVVGSIFVDGESFIRMYTGSRASDKYKFALQVIDPALVDSTLDTKARNGNWIKAGIEYDDLGRPVAYHVSQRKKGENIYTYQGRNYLRIPAEEMLHLYLPDYADQNRGLPIHTAGLLSLHYLHEYKKTALIAARAGASAMAFITTDYVDEVTTPDALYDEEDEEGPTELSFEPLTFQQLPEGADIKNFETNYPSGEYGDFVKTHLQAYASSVGVSYALLSGDLEGVNFSSLKNSNAQEKEYFKGLQQYMIDHFLEEVYSRWLEIQLANDTITIGGSPLNAFQYDKYINARWHGPRWEPIDEVKKANADRIRLQDGTTTISEILAQEGKEFDDILEQRKMEMEQLREAGLLTDLNTDIEVTNNDDQEDE